MGFEEVADGVWVARHSGRGEYDVNVTAVRGTRGLLVVDTTASASTAAAVIAGLRALGAGDVVEVVNTHAHFDHWYGNGAFREAFGSDLTLRAHETAAASMAAGDAGREDPPHGVRDTVRVPANTTFSSAVALDLGNRYIEVVHPGRGHTDGDLVVRVPDADVVVMGDLVEESAEREATPGFGPDCWLMEWPFALDVALGLLTPASVVVPGHGAVVDRAFVEAQRDRIGVLAETVRDLAGRGVPVDEALDAADSWPFPARYLADAVRRGYEHLPRSQKRLPLI